MLQIEKKGRGAESPLSRGSRVCVAKDTPPVIDFCISISNSPFAGKKVYGRRNEDERAASSRSL